MWVTAILKGGGKVANVRIKKSSDIAKQVKKGAPHTDQKVSTHPVLFRLVRNHFSPHSPFLGWGGIKGNLGAFPLVLGKYGGKGKGFARNLLGEP